MVLQKYKIYIHNIGTSNQIVNDYINALLKKNRMRIFNESPCIKKEYNIKTNTYIRRYVNLKLRIPALVKKKKIILNKGM